MPFSDLVCPNYLIWRAFMVYIQNIISILGCCLQDKDHFFIFSSFSCSFNLLIMVRVNIFIATIKVILIRNLLDVFWTDSLLTYLHKNTEQNVSCDYARSVSPCTMVQFTSNVEYMCKTFERRCHMASTLCSRSPISEALVLRTLPLFIWKNRKCSTHSGLV